MLLAIELGISIVDESEVRRYRRNWMVLHTTTLLMFTSYTIVLPTQHQFVTNARHPENHNVSFTAHIDGLPF